MGEFLGQEFAREFDSECASKLDRELDGKFEREQKMNLIQMQDGEKSFGARRLFERASFAVNDDEHVGVIGPNGAGKSTLFKILLEQDSLDQGLVVRSTSLRMAYLAQEETWPNEQTVEEYLAEQELTPVWELKRRAHEVGLVDQDFSRVVSSMSGGYRMRVKLLKLLAQKPNLMLLDEPTNYLDLETLLVLENFLINYDGAFLLISHDREFLKRTTDHILEVEAGEITKFNGHIEDYFEQKAMLREQLEKQALTAENKRKQILEFAARFGAKATKAKQAQSRLKSLAKMEVIELKDLPVSSVIRLPEAPSVGRVVVKLEHAQIGYQNRAILADVNLLIERGMRLGVVGLNGAGKSTLLRVLANSMAPQAGVFELGAQVKVGYFSQHVAERLNMQQTVLEALAQEASREVTPQEVLNMAGSLLFSGDDVQKRVSLLSGGEKSRVALGQILLQRCSFLLLDEPTNHLDFMTVEALTQALEKYQGTVVIVSHDRSFVRRVANQILEIHQGRVTKYPGTYDEYVWSQQNGVLSLRKGATTDGGVSSTGLGKDTRSFGSTAQLNSKKMDFESEVQRLEMAVPPRERRKNLEREIKALERDLLRNEKRQETLRTAVEDHGQKMIGAKGEDAAKLARATAAAQTELEAAESEWMELAERRQEAETQLAQVLKRDS